MSAVSENKKPENNQEMIDEKDEIMPEMPICVDISCDEEKESANQDEMILEEKPSNPEKESEKNPNSENDKALIIKISGISANSASSAAGKKNKINPKLTQNIRKQKNKKGVKSTKCNICRKSKDLISCRKCPKSFHVACLQIQQENLPKMFLCPKCKDKVRIQKKKYRERLLKKKQSLQQQNQTEPSTIIKDKVPPVKTALKNGEKADKAKNDKRKKFEEFSKKYPKFVVDGRVKYPIDDKLLQIYGSLFNDVTKSTLYVNT